MTPEPSKVVRNGITVTPLFVILAVIAGLFTLLVGMAVAADLSDAGGGMPSRPTLAALIVAATAWIGLFFAGLRDSIGKLTDQHVKMRDDRLDAMAAKLDDVSETLDAFRRQNDHALVVIHDEVNRFAEGHTEELVRLTEAIREWGEEQETKGELAGHRRAVGTAPVERLAAQRPVSVLRSTS